MLFIIILSPPRVGRTAVDVQQIIKYAPPQPVIKMIPIIPLEFNYLNNYNTSIMLWYC